MRTSDTVRALTLSLLVVVSVVAGIGLAPAVAPVGAQATSPPGFVGVPSSGVSLSNEVVHPADPPTGDLPEKAGEPPNLAGMPNGPPEWVHDKIPEHALDRVLSSRHAATTEVQFATAIDGHLAVVVTDNVNHGGREVAIPIEAIEDANDYRPQLAYGVHENGSRWTDQILYRDGYAIIEFPGFSTQTVTFDGTVSITGTPSVDGFSTNYEIGDKDSVSEFVVNITGATQYENDTDSASSVSNGGNFSVSVDGTGDPIAWDGSANPTITFTGVSSTVNRTETGTATTTGDTQSVTTNGNVVNNESVTLTGNKTEVLDSHSDETWGDANYYFGTTVGGENTHMETLLHDPPDTIEAITYTLQSAPGSDNGLALDLYIANGSTLGGSEPDGTKVADVNPPNSAGTYTVDISDYDATGQSAVTVSFITTGSYAGGNEWQLEWDGNPTSNHATRHIEGASTNTYKFVANVTARSPAPSNVTVTADGSGGSQGFGAFTDGEQKAGTVDIAPDSTQVTFSYSGGTLDYDVAYDDVTITEDPKADLDDDDTIEVTHSGTLADGATATYDLGGLALSTSTIGIETTGGSTVDAEVKYREVTETIDPSVEVNGNYLNHTGTLADGSTQQFTTQNASWIVEGTNYVNVTVGDGTLTADAPTPAVDLTYSHTAGANKDVTYTSEHFTSRWDVEHTYQSDRANANLTVPVETEVLSIRDAQQEVNSGGLSDLTGSDYDLRDGEVTVDLGSVSAGDTYRVVLDTSKVDVNNGSIAVTSGTVEGSPLASTIDLVTWANDSYIAAGGTTSGAEVYYVTSPSWGSASEYNVFESGGVKKVYLPGASAGSSLVLNGGNIEVEAQTGDVRIEPIEFGATPEFRVKPGPAGSGDTVSYTFTDAESGKTYSLQYRDSGTSIDEATASSPVTLQGSDSDAILVIREATGSGGGGGGGGGGGIVASNVESQGVTLPEGFPTMWVLAGLALLAGLVVVARSRDPGEVASRAASPARRIPGIGGILAGISQGILNVALRVAGGLDTAVRGIVSRVRSSPLALALVGVTGFIALLRLGLLPTIPENFLFALALIAAPIASFVGMRRLGVESWRVWAAVTVLSAFALFEVLNPGSVTEAIGAGIAEFFGLLLIGAGFALFIYLRNRGPPPIKVIARGRD